MSRNPLIKKEFVNEGKVFFGPFPAVLEVKGGGEKVGGRKSLKLNEIPIVRITEKVWLQRDPCCTVKVGLLKKVLEKCYCLTPNSLNPHLHLPPILYNENICSIGFYEKMK